MFEVSTVLYAEMFACARNIDEGNKMADAAWLELGTSCHKIEDLAVTEDLFASPPFAWASSYPNLTSLDLDNVSAYEGTHPQPQPPASQPTRPSYFSTLYTFHTPCLGRSTADHTVPLLSSRPKIVNLALPGMWASAPGPKYDHIGVTIDKFEEIVSTVEGHTTTSAAAAAAAAAIYP